MINSHLWFFYEKHMVVTCILHHRLIAKTKTKPTMKTKLILLATFFAMNISVLSAAEPSASQRPEKKKTTETNGPAYVDPETVREDRLQKDELRVDLLFRKLIPVPPKEAGFEEEQPDSNTRKGMNSQNNPALHLENSSSGDQDNKKSDSIKILAPIPPAEAEFSEE